MLWPIYAQAVQYEAHGCCGSPLSDVVAQRADTGDEDAAREREPRPEDEDQQHGFAIHRRQEGDAEADQRR